MDLSLSLPLSLSLSIYLYSVHLDQLLYGELSGGADGELRGYGQLHGAQLTLNGRWS